MDIFHFPGKIPVIKQVSNMNLIGFTIEELHIFNMRGEMLSHPLDLIGLIGIIIPKIVTSSNNISVRVCLVFNRN